MLCTKANAKSLMQTLVAGMKVKHWIKDIGSLGLGSIILCRSQYTVFRSGVWHVFGLHWAIKLG